MKFHHSIALALLVLGCFSAAMLSSRLMAILQSPSISGPQFPSTSAVAHNPQSNQTDGAMLPRLPGLSLPPAQRSLLPVTPPPKTHPAKNKSTLERKPAAASNSTTRFFRPQSDQRGNFRDGQEIPPVGINPPQIENTSRGSFRNNEPRSFTPPRQFPRREGGRNDIGSGPANFEIPGQDPSQDYYNRDQFDSFAPSQDYSIGGSDSDSDQAPFSGNAPLAGNGYDELDPELLRPESAYGATSGGSADESDAEEADGRRNTQQGIRATDSVGDDFDSGGSNARGRSPATTLPWGPKPFAAQPHGGTFFPPLPGTAIGRTAIGIRPKLGLEIGVGHPGTCDCDHCVVATGQTCRTCCHPLCVTRTILVPELYTVYRTVNETHYRPEVREIPYFREETLTHRVPVIEKFPVTVREPRTRNFTTYRKEEYQSPREVSYTVMVPQPKTRQVTSERVETYEVPEEEQYTVMVPKTKEVRKTKYKIVKDKEPIFKEYVVMVPQQRKRIMIDYETQKKEFIRKVPYTVMEERELERKVIRYRDEIAEVKIEEEYFEYVQQSGTWKSPRLRVAKSSVDGKEEYLQYREVEKEAIESIVVQERRKDEVEQTYTVTVPYKEEVEEVYWENEPYEEMVSRPSIAKSLRSRDVVKPYRVKIPYVEHTPQMYSINIPYQATETKYRVVPQQTPETKQQTVKRDMGRWVTETVALDTFEVGDDFCGCPTCCPKTRTIKQTRWVPNVVMQQLPYTTFKTIKKKVPYEVPVIKYRREPRQRMVAVTKFRTEVRERVEKVYSYETSSKPASFPVTKFRLVRKVRPKTVTVYREETRTKRIPVNRYVKNEETRRIPYSVKRVDPQIRDIRLPTLIVQPYQEDEAFTVTRPIPKKRTILKKVTVRRPYEDVEKFTVKVPQIRYRDVAEVEEYEVEVPREVTYTVEVPEVRIRKEFIEVERKVPFVETTMVTEMIPEVRTRRVYKSRERTVSDIRTETFMTSEPEIATKTVFDTKYRDIPVFQSELYWEDVPKILKRTVFKDVTRTVKRPAIKRYKVNVPYLVQVRVPKQLTRLVPRQITIPIEACCEQCCTEFTELNDVYGSYLQYGIRSVRSWVNGL